MRAEHKLCPLPKAMIDMDTNNPLDDIDVVQGFEQYLIDVTKDVKEKTFHFYLNGVGFAPLGNIQAIKAKAKNGKTQFTKILMAAALCGDAMGIKSGVEESSILYIDTEQDPNDSIRVLQGALTICSKTNSNYRYNEPSDRLHGLALRTVTPQKRLEYTRQAIEHYKPTLVIIDGIRDLIVDFNDLDESSTIIGELMRLSTDYNLALMSILHENKNDSNMRGHLGTEMVNKVTDVLETKKETDSCGDVYFKVEQIETRNKDIDKFEFVVDDFGVPDLPEMSHDEYAELKKEMEICHSKMWSLHQENTGKYGLRRADFIEVMISELGIKKTRAYEKFKVAEQQGILEIDTTSKQIMLNKMPKDEISAQMEKNNEMPF